MDKAGFIKAVSRRAGCSALQAEKIVNAGISVISDELASGDDIKLVGFGKFTTKRISARSIKLNEMLIERHERIVPCFKPGKKLTDAVCAGK